MDKGMPIGILFELTTVGEGKWWATTFEGAMACAKRRKHPVAITVLYLHDNARMSSGTSVVLAQSSPLAPASVELDYAVTITAHVTDGRVL